MQMNIEKEQRLISQRHALAKFGHYALSETDLDKILGEACRLAAEGLGQKFAKVAQVIPGRDEIYIRAYVGFDLDDQDRWIASGRGSSAGHAIMREQPNFSDNADIDTRFDMAGFVQRAGIHSLTNVLIMGDDRSGPKYWGVLEVDSPEYGAFSEDQVDFLNLYANLIASAVRRQNSRKLLEDLAEDRRRLLQELQHRVKNNFATMASLVRLEKRRTQSEETRETLGRIEQRSQALGLVHEHLYRSFESQTISVGDYLRELVAQLAHAHDFSGHTVEIDIRADEVVMDPERAIPLGQITSEFVSNSLKYAFGPDGGKLTIALTNTGNGARLEMSDDGPGLPGEEIRNSGTGMKIIAGLAGQIGGDAEWFSQNGTHLRVEFPLR